MLKRLGLALDTKEFKTCAWNMEQRMKMASIAGDFLAALKSYC